MLPTGLNRVLMTTDAAGGVSRYASDLARDLGRSGVTCLLAGFGPPPERTEPGEGDIETVWTAGRLDWLVDDETALDAGVAALSELARDWGADIVHVNAPTQAAGLPRGIPVVAVSHSCVPTWQAAVRSEPLAPGWRWHVRRNRAGFDRADIVLSPSAAHADALRRTYGEIARLRVVHNATEAAPVDEGVRDDVILAAGRWWDAGKGGDTLDAAAAATRWPILMAGPLSGPAGRGLALSHARALGVLPATDIRRLMSRSAIFAAPSRYEPFGLAVLEAAWRGCALVVADIPTFRELWEGAAVFVDAGDPDAWAAALDGLSGDPGRLARLAAAARRKAQACKPVRQVAGVLDAYAAAWERAGRGSQP